MVCTRKKSYHLHQEGDHDRLSSMPEDILYHILSFLDVADAAKTSVLAKKWRHVWTSMPGFIIDSETLENHQPLCWKLYPSTNRYRFWKFVENESSHLLRRLHGFDILLQLQVLLGLASRHGVQELNIDALSVNKYKQQSIFFPKLICKVLEKLSFRFGGLVTLQSSTNFSSLKSLYLLGVRIPNRHIARRLFSRQSSVLESLNLEYCTMNGIRVLDVSSHRLKSLTFINIGEWKYSNIVFRGKLRVNAPNLTSLSYIGDMLKEFEYLNLPSTCNATKLISATHEFTHSCDDSTRLALTNIVLKYFAPALGEPRSIICPIYRVKWLKLEVRSTASYVEGLIELIKLLPNVAALQINFIEPFEQRSDLEPREEDTPSLSSRLNHITISNLDYSTITMELVKFLFGHSTVLEMVLVVVKTPNMRAMILDKLLSFPKASRGVSLVVDQCPW